MEKELSKMNSWWSVVYSK